MANPAEDAIRQKWSDQEAQAKEQQSAVTANKKRKMVAQQAIRDDERVVVLDELIEADGPGLARASRSTRARNT